MKKIIFFLIGIWLSLAGICQAKIITLTWDPSSGDVWGYKLYYGFSSRNYEEAFDVGNTTSCEFEVEEGEKYYLAVTAYNGNGESGFSNEVFYEYTLNSPPIADAGPDQTVTSNDIVFLDASASYDNDDSIVTYLWQQLSGPSVELYPYQNEVTVNFDAPIVNNDTQLIFQLTVTDEYGDSSTDQVIVTVQPEPAGVPGDIDGDGDKDAADKILILQHRGQPVSTCPACDVDGDGDIDNNDVLAWYRL
jgi:hypothetical protein